MELRSKRFAHSWLPRPCKARVAHVPIVASNAPVVEKKGVLDTGHKALCPVSLDPDGATNIVLPYSSVAV